MNTGSHTNTTALRAGDAVKTLSVVHLIIIITFFSVFPLLLLSYWELHEDREIEISAASPPLTPPFLSRLPPPALFFPPSSASPSPEEPYPSSNLQRPAADVRPKPM